MNITFRKATRADKQQLLSLLSRRQDEANAIHAETGNPVFEGGGDLFDRLLDDPRVSLFVGETEGAVVATLTAYVLPRIRLGGYFAFFEDILVSPELRGRGIGKQLLTFAISEMKKDPTVKKIKLGSRKDEEGLHRFYGQTGFIYKEKLFQLPLSS